MTEFTLRDLSEIQLMKLTLVQCRALLTEHLKPLDEHNGADDARRETRSRRMHAVLMMISACLDSLKRDGLPPGVSRALMLEAGYSLDEYQHLETVDDITRGPSP